MARPVEYRSSTCSPYGVTARPVARPMPGWTPPPVVPPPAAPPRIAEPVVRVAVVRRSVSPAAAPSGRVGDRRAAGGALPQPAHEEDRCRCGQPAILLHDGGESAECLTCWTARITRGEE